MIALGSDHVGIELKEKIIEYLDEEGIKFKDYGCFTNERVDYPKYGLAVANAITNKECEKGIVFCGTGVGISIAANKIRGIRAVVCSEPYSAKLSKEHNNTNILSMGARVVGYELAKMIVSEWLNAKFEGGRHQNRIDMITQSEQSKKDVKENNGE